MPKISVRFLPSVILVVSCFSAVPAHSAPFIANEVRAQLTRPANGKIPTIIVYRAPLSIEQIRDEKGMRDFTHRQEEAVLDFLSPRTFVARRTLWIANATRIDLDETELRQILQNERIAGVYSAKTQAHLIENRAGRREELEPATYGLEKIGRTRLWQSRPELTGKGVRVGIIDTGLSAQHPRLKGRTLAFRNFISPRDGEEAFDDHGHGTHVGGTVAGGANKNLAIGVAPEAGLLIAKTFSRYGGTEIAYLLEALQWVADPDGNPQTHDGADIVSGSWNVDGDETAQTTPEANPFCVAVSNLLRLGVVSVFAAGNDGPAASSIKVPGACPDAVTVAASDENDQIADFSSRGPVIWKSGVIAKPDITAPGVDILSADYEGDVRTKSGTSMATPHISGAFALLKQADPNASVADLKSRLLFGATALGPADAWGAGRADLFKSLVR